MPLMDDTLYEVKFVTAAVTQSQTTASLIAAPGPGKCIVVDRVLFSSDSTAAACNFCLISNTTIIFGKLYWASPDMYDSKDYMGWRCNPDEPLNYTYVGTAGGNFALNVKYHIQG